MQFLELLETADNSAIEGKQVITYKADGNGVKVVNKPLINLSRLYNCADIIGMYADFRPADEMCIIYKDFAPCWEVQKIYNNETADNMKIALIRYSQNVCDYADFCEMIQNSINKGVFIKNDALKVLELHGSTDLLNRAIESKNEIMRRRNEEAAREAKERAERERLEEEEKQLKADHERAEKAAFLCGFADGKTQIQIERIYTILSKKQWYKINKIDAIKSRRDFIIDIISEGGKPERKDGVKHYYGSKWNVKESKPKTEYRLYTAEGSYYEITKTEFDFANFMMNRA